MGGPGVSELLEAIEAGQPCRRVVLGSGGLRGSEQAILRTVVALRHRHRPRSPSPASGSVGDRRRAHRAGARRGRRDPRLREHLPAPRLSRRAWRPEAAARSSATTTAGPTTSTARCATRRSANGELAFDVADSACRADAGARCGARWCGSTLARRARRSTTATDGLKALLRRGAATSRTTSCAFEHTWEIDCNWKVFQDNTIECYHCPTTHPEFSRAIVQDPASSSSAIGGRNWIHHSIPFRDGVPEGLTLSATRTAS